MPHVNSSQHHPQLLCLMTLVPQSDRINVFNSGSHETSACRVAACSRRGLAAALDNARDLTLP